MLINPSLYAEEATYSLEACFTQLLSSRYSGNRYDASAQVTKQQIREIVEAGRLAPSSNNEQPWNFIVCDRNLTPEAYETVLNSLVERNLHWAKNAPLLILSVASTKSPNGQENRWGSYDTGAAAFAMMLKAISMGLMAHQMGGFDREKIQKEFSIPENFLPMAVMVIGYRSLNQMQPERKRKPLSENFFLGGWGKQIEGIN